MSKEITNNPNKMQNSKSYRRLDQFSNVNNQITSKTRTNDNNNLEDYEETLRG